MTHPILAAMSVLAIIAAMRQPASSEPTTEPTTQPAPIRVMSFNVRYGTAPDGANDWSHRRELFFKTIEAFDPDLLGTQEVLAMQADAMRQRLQGYGFVGVGRDDGQRKGEFAAIFYRAARFDVFKSGNFWLSEKPDVPGSKSWDTSLTRMASWCILSDRATNRKLLVVNSHWDHIGKQARLESGRLIRRMIGELSGGNPDLPVIVTGDFNSTEDDPPLPALLHGEDKDAFVLTDSYREVHPQRSKDEASFHDFKGGIHGSRIDFILHSVALDARDATIDRSSKDGRFPSDHFPVEAILAWK